jgi:hypothetical protein
MSPLATLSWDLKDQVLDFLPLRSCLRYTQASHQCLRDVLPHLKRRRSRQFCKRLAYQMGNPHKLRPINSLNDPTSIPIETSSPLQYLTGDKEQIHIVPSVTERIESLYRALPYSHSSSEGVRRLLLELQGQPPDLLLEDGIRSSHFPSSLQELHLVTVAHRSHEELIRACTVNCSPPRANLGFWDNPGAALTTTLEQYIGDVLLAYFLVGHAIAGMVEGFTSHSHWTDHLLSCDSSPQLWYKRWVFMHSCILRTFPVTTNQLQQYKLPAVGIIGRTDPQGVDYIHPHYCFLGCSARDTVVEDTTKVVSHIYRACLLDFDERTAEGALVYRMDTRWHSFGQLGPAFRGRDHVQSVHMSPDTMSVFLSSPGFAMAPPWLMMEEGQHVIHDNPLYHAWFTAEVEPRTDSESLGSWFLRMPQICYQNRPMTVEPPVISLNAHLSGL